MTDNYAPCPCGSGKKLKFCKCVDQPQEYEKIVKLIEGNQGLAAVDRINQLLDKTPNAAWLLAIKGELTLGMQEFESFRETANRFLKLKPDNPLALIMKSIVASIDNEPVQNVARYLLEGMSESREGMPALTLSAIRILIRAMAANRQLSMVGYWSDVLSALSGDGPDDDSPHLDPQINLLAKAPSRLLDDPAGSEWKERLAEVLSLTRTFRFAQAETKLRSILRDFPDQPGPLSHLLRAQCAQIDQQAAVATAKKLASHLEISANDRAYFAAVAMELEPKHASLQCEMILKYCEVDSDERIHDVLSGLDFVEAPEGEGLEQVREYYAAIVDDEVPAKRIYSIFDKALRQESESTEREVASSVGTVVVYGKQTDKPARALFIANLFPAYEKRITEVEEALKLGDEITDVEVPVDSVYVEFLRRPRAIVGDAQGTPTLEEQATALVDDFLDMPINVLNGKSPAEATQEEALRAPLLGLLSHLEGEQSIVVGPDVIPEIYKRLELERPSVAVDPNADSLRLNNVLDMDRVDSSTLNDRQIKGLMVRAMGMGASRVFYRCALAVREREGLADDAQLQVAAMSGLLSIVGGIDERIEICQELEDILAKANAPVGKIVIQRMSLLHAAGRPQEAQQALLEGAQKYPNDPYLMSFIQYAMQSQGMAPGAGPGPGAGDDLAMKMMQNATRQPAQESGSGLVLPGQGPGPGADGGGESKLWLPGS